MEGAIRVYHEEMNLPVEKRFNLSHEAAAANVERVLKLQNI